MPVTDRAPPPPPPPSFNDSQRRVRAVPPRRPARGGVSGRSRIAHRSFLPCAHQEYRFVTVDPRSRPPSGGGCACRRGVYTLAWSGWRRASQLGHPPTHHALRFRNPAGIRGEDPRRVFLRVTATVATSPTSVTSRRRAVRVARHASWNEAARVYSARTAQRPHQPCQRRGQRCRYTDRQLPNLNLGETVGLGPCFVRQEATRPSWCPRPPTALRTARRVPRFYIWQVPDSLPDLGRKSLKRPQSAAGAT